MRYVITLFILSLISCKSSEYRSYHVFFINYMEESYFVDIEDEMGESYSEWYDTVIMKIKSRGEYNREIIVLINELPVRSEFRDLGITTITVDPGLIEGDFTEILSTDIQFNK